MGYTAAGYSDMPINHKIFLLRSLMRSKHLADEQSCVIIGRCADYALEDYPNVLNAYLSRAMKR